MRRRVFLSSLILSLLVLLSGKDARACVCRPFAVGFWPSGQVDVPRSVRPLILLPAGGSDTYRLLDAGPASTAGVAVDLGPNDPRRWRDQTVDLGPSPPEAKEVEAVPRAFGARSTGSPLALELAPRVALPAGHRFLLTEAGRVRGVFLTGETVESPRPAARPLRLQKVEYPNELLRNSCDTTGSSLVYRVDGGGGPQLFGIWAPGAPEASPLGFTRSAAGLVELGQTGACSADGVFLKKGGLVDLVIRERGVDGSYGPPVRVRLELPPP